MTKPLLILGEHRKNAVKMNQKMRILLAKLTKPEQNLFRNNKLTKATRYTEIDTKILLDDFLQFFGKPNEIVKQVLFKNVYKIMFYYNTKSIVYKFFFVGADAPPTKTGCKYLGLLNHGTTRYCLSAIKLLFNKRGAHADRKNETA